MRSLRSRLTYANVVATLALFVALSTGGAWAAHQVLIGGKQIKNGSITGNDVKKRSLTGAQIKPESLTGRQVAESKLGKVPSAGTADTAANAAALGGVPLTGLLRTDRVLSGSVTLDTVGTLILRDPRTGLQVRNGSSGLLRLVNPSAQDTLVIRGMGSYSTGDEPNLRHLSTLAPGAQEDINFNAAGFGYGQFIVLRRSLKAGAPVLQLTCAEDASLAGNTLSCVGVG